MHNTLIHTLNSLLHEGPVFKLERLLSCMESHECINEQNMQHWPEVSLLAWNSWHALPVAKKLLVTKWYKSLSLIYDGQHKTALNLLNLLTDPDPLVQSIIDYHTCVMELNVIQNSQSTTYHHDLSHLLVKLTALLERVENKLELNFPNFLLQLKILRSIAVIQSHLIFKHGDTTLPFVQNLHFNSRHQTLVVALQKAAIFNKLLSYSHDDTQTPLVNCFSQRQAIQYLQYDISSSTLSSNHSAVHRSFFQLGINSLRTLQEYFVVLRSSGIFFETSNASESHEEYKTYFALHWQLLDLLLTEWASHDESKYLVAKFFDKFNFESLEPPAGFLQLWHTRLHYLNSEYARCESQCSNLLADFGNNVDYSLNHHIRSKLLFLLACACYKQGKYNFAVSVLEKLLLEHSCNASRIYNFIGLLELQMGCNSIALTRFQQAALADEQYLDAICNIAKIYNAQKEYQLESDTYQTLLQEPRLKQASFQYQFFFEKIKFCLVQSLMRQNRFTHAAHHLRTLIAHLEKTRKKASNSTVDSRQIDVFSVRAYRMLVLLMLNAGDHKLCWIRAEQYLRTTCPFDIVLLLYQAEALVNLKRPHAALSSLENALKALDANVCNESSALDARQTQELYSIICMLAGVLNHCVKREDLAYKYLHKSYSIAFSWHADDSTLAPPAHIIKRIQDATLYNLCLYYTKIGRLREACLEWVTYRFSLKLGLQPSVYLDKLRLQIHPQLSVISNKCISSIFSVEIPSWQLLQFDAHILKIAAVLC